jgi:CRISPR system Cascade subunit CasE
MLLHRIHLNPRCGEARRDLADPYQMHATLSRVFSASEQEKCPAGEVLWRMEPETDAEGRARVLIQSKAAIPDWSRLKDAGWLASADAPIKADERLALDLVQPGQAFRFRLRASPSIARDGKRRGLLQANEQEAWLTRQAARHGFSLPTTEAFSPFDDDEDRPDVLISQSQMLVGTQHAGNRIQVHSVLFEGRLTVTDTALFRNALVAGIGHGKVLGLGLLSVAPAR